MRPKLVALAILAVGAGAAGACAWSSQRVHLRPTIPFARSDVAGGRAVELHVVDERPRTVIGHRIGPGVGGSITSDRDLSIPVRDAVADALRRHGFTVAEPDSADAAFLSIALRSYEYEVARGAASLGVHAWAGLHARCRSGARGYENFYREHRVRDRLSFPLSTERNDVLLNETLSGVLRKPLADRKLLDCLAGSA
jgi:hypothetical protein